MNRIAKGTEMRQFFTPRESITRELSDGRLIQVATAGVPMNLSDAIFYEILSAEDFQTMNLPTPADYGTRFLGASHSTSETATQTTTVQNGRTVFANRETDAASRTTTITPAQPPAVDQSGGAATSPAKTTGTASPTSGGTAATDSTGGGERIPSR